MRCLCGTWPGGRAGGQAQPCLISVHPIRPCLPQLSSPPRRPGPESPRPSAAPGRVSAWAVQALLPVWRARSGSHSYLVVYLRGEGLVAEGHEAAHGWLGRGLALLGQPRLQRVHPQLGHAGQLSGAQPGRGPGGGRAGCRRSRRGVAGSSGLQRASLLILRGGKKPARTPYDQPNPLPRDGASGGGKELTIHSAFSTQTQTVLKTATTQLAACTRSAETRPLLVLWPLWHVVQVPYRGTGPHFSIALGPHNCEQNSHKEWTVQGFLGLMPVCKISAW